MSFASAVRLSDSTDSLASREITVVMPLYNKGRHVARAIDSVLIQQSGFHSLIIVDDSSTDDGIQRVMAYNDPRIRLISRDVPGPGGYAARNVGINHASTEWIAFLDADDEWKPTFTAAIQTLIMEYRGHIGCVATSFDIQDPNGTLRIQPFGASCSPHPRFLTFEDYLRGWLRHGDSPIWTSACAFRRAILLEAGLFPEGRCRRGGDKDLWLRAIALKPLAFDPVPRATYYRDSVNMVTSTMQPDAAHCIVTTIDALRPACDRKSRQLLKKVSNLETFTYSIAAARAGKLTRRIYHIFYNRSTSLQYLCILILQFTPRFFSKGIAKNLERIRRLRFA